MPDQQDDLPERGQTANEHAELSAQVLRRALNLSDDDFSMAEAIPLLEAAAGRDYLRALRREGELPERSHDDETTIT